MADLRNLEVEVDRAANLSKMGPSGKKARMETSCFLNVGGSRTTYPVTINFDSKNGHYCPCQGWGSKQRMCIRHNILRDKRNPEHWCKHVVAALEDVEKIAEAQELSASIYGKAERTATVKIKPARPAFENEPVKAEPTARERLAEIQAEADAIRETLKAEEAAELRDAIAALLEKHDWVDVQEALKNVA